MIIVITGWVQTVEWTTGMEHWTGLSYFPFLDKFLDSFWKPSYFVMIFKYQTTIDDCNNDNNCLLHAVFS